MHTKQSVIKEAYEKLVKQSEFFAQERDRHGAAYDEYEEKYRLAIIELDLFERDINP